VSITINRFIRSQLVCLLFTLPVFGQQGNLAPCQEVKQVTIATDSVKRKLLFDYIRQCSTNNSFNSDYDKGILHLYEFQDSKNRLCWILYPRIDDYYKDNPPTKFSDFDGDIVLVYEADSTGRAIENKGDIPAINRCLEQIIGDRVFTRPSIRTRWTSDVLPFINQKRNHGNSRISTGGGQAIKVRFNKDNTYSISRFG
jgi:hypothetical protein